jgi:hypothetical protein
LRTAIRDQLVDRYLDDYATHGVYLVVWFSPERWVTEDWRRRRCAASREPLAQELAMAADEIWTDIGRVVCPVVLDAALP